MRANFGTLTLSSLLLHPFLLGQQPTSQQLELDLAKRATSALLAHADALSAQKQHARALDVRREVILEYDSDNETARTLCGFVKVAPYWRRDETKPLQDKDLRGDASALRKLENDWKKLAEQFANEHQAVAKAFAAAGNADAANRHWRRVLRFKPGDATAIAAVQPVRFEDFEGDVRDVAMLRKSRAIRQSVTFLKKTAFEITKLEGRKHAILQKAALQHSGVATRNFEVWGTLSESKLRSAAEHAERCLSLCQTLFGTSSGEIFRPRRVCNLVLVSTKADYEKVLNACADQFPPDRLAFLRDQVQLAFLNVGDEVVRCFRTDGRDDFMLDMVVRGVIQDATKLDAHGLWEGIGHAACGFFFDRTLAFLLEQKKEHTVSAWQQKPLLPDMETWRKIAAESAWSRSDTSTSQLMLIHAAKFDTEQRVKSWAMLDYLLRWRPELVASLDASKTEQQRTPPQVEAEFLRTTNLDLAKLDVDWRDYWAKGKPLRDAILRDPKGDKDAVLGALAIADAVNAARVAAQRGPLGFTLADSADAKAALAYLVELARVEETMRKDPGQSLSRPTPPACLGRTILATRASDPATAVARFVANPATRDLLLHPGRTLLPCLAQKDLVLLDLGEPLATPTRGKPWCWPGNRQVGVPSAILVSDLPPRLQRELAEAGKKATDLVGMPVSAHFARELQPNDVGGCFGRLECEGGELATVRVCIQGAGSGSEEAPGCMVLVPLQPLPKGKDVTMTWEMPRGVLEREEVFPKTEFRVEGAAAK